MDDADEGGIPHLWMWTPRTPTLPLEQDAEDGKVGDLPDIEDTELVAEIDDAVREHVRIPPDSVSVGDRVGVLLGEYRAAGERVEELEETLASREQQIEELEEQLAEARTGNGGLRS